jgi:hypothetical protein
VEFNMGGQDVSLAVAHCDHQEHARMAAGQLRQATAALKNQQQCCNRIASIPSRIHSAPSPEYQSALLLGNAAIERFQTLSQLNTWARP